MKLVYIDTFRTQEIVHLSAYKIDRAGLHDPCVPNIGGIKSMHRFFTDRLTTGDSCTLIYTERLCYCTNCSIGNLAQCRWKLTHVPLLKEIDLGFSMETRTGDMDLRSQFSRKKRQLAEGNICILRTQPSEYNGIEFLPFTVHHKDTIQWNARHYSSYGGMFSAGDEVVFVTEDFEVLSASFVDGVPTICMSRTDKVRNASYCF
ncbi:unnamed protein product [Choristocarpus tenellus]